MTLVRLFPPQANAARVALAHHNHTQLIKTMNIRSRKFKATLLLIASAATLAVQTGFAQATATSTPASTAPKEETVTLEKFEVTGSMIKVSELVGPSPIDIVTDRTI